ncbi:MAG: universal stress protein [Alphaproteobacteria bacterium]|nr:universal stress protein [Alphaproteobacteria bacterium]
MIKSILVALDDSESSEAARTLSIHLAKSYKSTVTGIGILDEPWIAAPEAIPLGGAAFKVELDEQLLQDAKRRVHNLEKNFSTFCKSEGIDSSIIDATGVPAYEIEYFLSEYDILIIGKNADFHFNPTHETTLSVRQLLKDNPRPVIVTGKTLPNQHSSHVLVAFDGTFASSRALHMALLIGMFKGKTVHIASISSDEETAKDQVTTAAKLCQHHNINPHLHPIASSEKPAKLLLNLAEDINPSLIVMGAYGHSGIAYLLTGSCAKVLLSSTNIPLFFYH